jgi:hypothetical protein
MIEGGCYCGRVRYASEAAPFHETVCHCSDCRRIAGASAVAWFSVPADRFSFTAEKPVQFRSSARVVRSFCGTCGTPLTYQRDDLASEIDVTIASLDDADAVPPKDHTHTRHKLQWDAICDGLPAFPEGRTSAEKDDGV